MSYGTRVHTHTHTHTEHSIQQQVVTKQVLINLRRLKSYRASFLTTMFYKTENQLQEENGEI